MTVERLLLRNATLPDGSTGSVLIEGGLIAAVGVDAATDGARIIDAAGRWVLPGLVDIGPATAAGSIERELAAALAGGVTTLLTTPTAGGTLGTATDVRQLLQEGKAADTGLEIAAAVTIGLAGQGLTDMHSLRAAGARAVSNGTEPVADTLVLRSAMRYAADLDLCLLLRPADPWLARSGAAHDGRVATRLGLVPIPVAAETTALARDLVLIEETGVRAHVGPISSAAGVAMIATARERGLRVTADTTLHHLFLTELDLMGYDPNCHVLPPLREQADRDALRAAVATGLLTVRSDHTPLAADDKVAPFPATEPGISGTRTMLGFGLRLVDDGVLDVPGLIRAFASGPARALGLEPRGVAPGLTADLVIVDPDAVWNVTPDTDDWRSSGRNTPFAGWELRGAVDAVVRGGDYRDLA